MYNMSNIQLTSVSIDSFTLGWDLSTGGLSNYLYLTSNTIPSDITLATTLSSYTVTNVPYNTNYTAGITICGTPLNPPISFSIPIRPYPIPPIPIPQSPICQDRYPLPTSAKKPIYTFNRREFWSWGANKVGRNCVQGDTQQ